MEPVCTSPSYPFNPSRLLASAGKTFTEPSESCCSGNNILKQSSSLNPFKVTGTVIVYTSCLPNLSVFFASLLCRLCQSSSLPGVDALPYVKLFSLFDDQPPLTHPLSTPTLLIAFTLSRHTLLVPFLSICVDATQQQIFRWTETPQQGR